MAALPMAGYSYTAAGSTVPSGRGPFDTVFWFNSTIDDFSLVMTADYPVTAGGSDPLVPGSGSGASLAGSFEYCTENATACAGPGFQDGRLVTAGTLYAPEPATFSLLGAGSVLLPLVRRKRAPAKRGAAWATPPSRGEVYGLVTLPVEPGAGAPAPPGAPAEPIGAEGGGAMAGEPAPGPLLPNACPCCAAW
jgi:hypothetical protein